MESIDLLVSKNNKKFALKVKNNPLFKKIKITGIVIKNRKYLKLIRNQKQMQERAKTKITKYLIKGNTEFEEVWSLIVEEMFETTTVDLMVKNKAMVVKNNLEEKGMDISIEAIVVVMVIIKEKESIYIKEIGA